MMKLDLHVHTIYSLDGSVEPKDYLKFAKRSKLKGFAITDHNEVKGAIKTFKLAKEKEFKDLAIIRGIEISSSEGHILGYGISDLIPRGLSPRETIEKIVEAGGVAVAAHPFRRASGIGAEVVRHETFKAVEVLNHRSMHKENQRALELAREKNTGLTGGSDSHFVKELGTAATKFQINSTNESDIIAQISKSKTVPVGSDSTFGQGVIMYSKLIAYWIKRGFRRV
jgi:predicted metal-dependent phosphoesterase TrpH